MWPGNKVGLSRIHTQKSCLIPTGCLQIRAVFTLSFCLVDQPIIVLLDRTAPTPYPPSGCPCSCVQCGPTVTEPVKLGHRMCYCNWLRSSSSRWLIFTRYLRWDGFYLGDLKLALKKCQAEQHCSSSIHLHHRVHVGWMLSIESFTPLGFLTFWLQYTHYIFFSWAWSLWVFLIYFVSE